MACSGNGHRSAGVHSDAALRAAHRPVIPPCAQGSAAEAFRAQLLVPILGLLGVLRAHGAILGRIRNRGDLAYLPVCNLEGGADGERRALPQQAVADTVES